MDDGKQSAFCVKLVLQGSASTGNTERYERLLEDYSSEQGICPLFQGEK